MSQQLGVLEITRKAEKDLSTKQYYFVEMGGAAGQIDVCDNAGDLVLGVLQNKPNAANKLCAIRVMGTTKVICGGTVTEMARVGTDVDGKCVVKSTAADLVAGIALEAGAAGDIIEILLTPAAQRAA